jgi:hypothetical protein
VPLVNYDQATQDRINALNVEKANTRVAEQRAKSAGAEARANEILAASVSNTPNVLVSKCLDAARESGHQAAGLLAEHRRGADGAGEVAGRHPSEPQTRAGSPAMNQWLTHRARTARPRDWCG